MSANHIHDALARVRTLRQFIQATTDLIAQVRNAMIPAPEA